MHHLIFPPIQKAKWLVQSSTVTVLQPKSEAPKNFFLLRSYFCTFLFVLCSSGIHSLPYSSVSGFLFVSRFTLCWHIQWCRYHQGRGLGKKKALSFNFHFFSVVSALRIVIFLHKEKNNEDAFLCGFRVGQIVLSWHLKCQRNSGGVITQLKIWLSLLAWVIPMMDWLF